MKTILPIVFALLAFSINNTGLGEPEPKTSLREALYITDYSRETSGHISLHRKVNKPGAPEKEDVSKLRKWLNSKIWRNGAKNSVPGIESLASIVITVDGDFGYSLTLLADKRTIIVADGKMMDEQFQQLSSGDCYVYEDAVLGSVLFGIFSKYHPPCVEVAANYERVVREARKQVEMEVGGKKRKSPVK